MIDIKKYEAFLTFVIGRIKGASYLRLYEGHEMIRQNCVGLKLRQFPTDIDIHAGSIEHSRGMSIM